LDDSLKAGILATRVLTAPGTQGAAITGTQGAGVKRTGGGLLVAGLATELHMAKVGRLTTGLWSMMLAAGILAERVRLAGSTMSEHGAVPKLHKHIAPITV